jgi:hypothetical protein
LIGYPIPAKPDIASFSSIDYFIFVQLKFKDMKFLRLTFLIALIGGFGLLNSCKPNDTPEPSIEEVQLGLLKKVTTWKIDKVRFGPSNTDRTSEFTGMTLTITGTFPDTTTPYQYQVAGITNGNLTPWPQEKPLEFYDWKFDIADPENSIIRLNDDLPMTYSVTATQLQLIFNYDGDGFTANGRTSAVKGSWTFLFKP